MLAINDRVAAAAAAALQTWRPNPVPWRSLPCRHTDGGPAPRHFRLPAVSQVQSVAVPGVVACSFQGSQSSRVACWHQAARGRQSSSAAIACHARLTLCSEPRQRHTVTPCTAGPESQHGRGQPSAAAHEVGGAAVSRAAAACRGCTCSRSQYRWRLPAAAARCKQQRRQQWACKR